MILPKLLPLLKRGLGPELVTNGNMETGSPPTGWLDGGDGPTFTSAADTYTGATGTKSLNIAIGTGKSSGTALQAITMTVGATYRITFWAKLIAGTLVSAVVYNASFSALTGANIQNLTPAVWTKYSTTFKCSSAGGYVAVLVVGAQTNSARFDDISIKRVY